MYGWIHESIRQYMVRAHGEEFWQQVLDRAGFESGKENIQNHRYPDSESLKLIEAVSQISGLSINQVWECYGRNFLDYLFRIGWDQLLTSMSPDLRGFLESLDALHYFGDHVVFKTKLRGPLFRCDDNNNGTLTLHYISDRTGLWPIVYGCVCEVAAKLFDLDIDMTILSRNQRIMETEHGEKLKDHVIFLIAPKPGQSLKLWNVEKICQKEAQLTVDSPGFAKLFPYHFIIDENCKICHFGMALANHIPLALLQKHPPMTSIFRIYRPHIPLDFDTLIKFKDAVFVLEIRLVPAHLDSQMGSIISANSGEDRRSSTFSIGAVSNLSNLSSTSNLKLKGQMLLLQDKRHIIYLCSPHVHTVPELLQNSLRINNIPLHDRTRDIILLNQHRHQEVKMAAELKATEDNLEKMAADIEEAKEKADQLLKQVLPASVAEQLKQGKQVNACEFSSVTVMFTDVPNFPNIVPQTNPKDIVTLLNQLFTTFDNLVTMHSVYKVETVGDCYVTLSGAPEPTHDHCERICNVALGMTWEATAVTDPTNRKVLIVRSGIHTGGIVTGVVGTKMPRYCLFGDTVNTASRMESHGQPGKIHCSQQVYETANKTGRFTFEPRGEMEVKGKGRMHTYFLISSEKYSLWEIIEKQRDDNVHSIEGYQEIQQLSQMPAEKPTQNGVAKVEKNEKKYQKSRMCVVM